MNPAEAAPRPTQLIVDDQASNIQITSEILVGAYTVLSAKDGDKALDLASSRQIGLACLDVMMPDLDGYEVCWRLKEDEQTREIPEEIRDQRINSFFTTNPSEEGNTGLGLSISYDIVVEDHQGKLEATRELGESTEFVIRLPLGG